MQIVRRQGGRVERANGVLQDHVIKEMRLKKISNIDETNNCFPEFIKEYNEKFGKLPRDSEDANRLMRQEDDLKRIFARRSIRKLSKNWKYNGQRKQENLGNIIHGAK